jgi:hypothetical protein
VLEEAETGETTAEELAVENASAPEEAEENETESNRNSEEGGA